MDRQILVSGVYEVMRDRFDNMGDFLKQRESMIPADGRFLAGLPLIVRLDGSSFSKFTKSMKRPFDDKFSKLMEDTAMYIADYFHADLVFTQSDEITLLFSNQGQIMFDGIQQQLPYGGRYQKILSEFSGITSSFFRNKLYELFPDKDEQYPYFDCRAYQAFSDDEAMLSVLWRCIDAHKNSVSQMASAYYSHKTLTGVSTSARIRMLDSREVPEEQYANLADRYKYGILKIKQYTKGPLPADKLAKIPEAHRPAQLEVVRKVWTSVPTSLTFFRQDVKEIIDKVYLRGSYAEESVTTA